MLFDKNTMDSVLASMNSDKIRNPERISEVLELLRVEWLANSGLRLGQVLANKIGDKDLSLVEDDELFDFVSDYFVEKND